ncbi:hypothetical protein GLW08_17715 [Pontibacillus yanchengensis]|uniref:YpoC-like domain-containing protein n=2 Tax=Pontibacillus yanchengensis TaxID=462910 RepID=A0A6I4ZY77_9BACI|nr:hypothetical protein [Pontibacillus yanchengensis]MYL32782.1 hypothetical protein [Pontibacillus yanchengensis]MYL55176.1 hypothetical protein [Pontibacillus yanchengensis]
MFNQERSYIEAWKKEREYIASLYQSRQTDKASACMEKHITGFIKSLYLLNDMEYREDKSTNEDVERFQYKPMNMKDRLTFIKQSKQHYHAYIQLDELFEALEKQFAKVKIIKKKDQSSAD